MTMKDPSLGSTRVHSKDFSPTRPQRHPVHRRLATYALYLVSALLSATCIALYARRGFVIPHAYALCSPSGIKAIYTVSSAQPVVQCMVVNGSRIQDVGSLEDVYRRWDASIEAIQAGQKRALPKPRLEARFIKSGSIIVPGMSDSHVHSLEYGASRMIPLEKAQTPEEAVAAVRAFILSDEDVRQDPEKYVQGWGWDHTKWPEGKFPFAAHLDSDPIVSAHRVALQSKDGHALWVTSRVLDESAPLPDHVEGGLILRDVIGAPTGVFLDNAQNLVPVPPPTHRDLEKQFKLVVDDALTHGLTAVHDAGFDPKSLEFFKSLAEQKKLPIRIYGMTYFDENAEYWGDKVPPIIGAADGRFSARSVKFFGDGALRTGGAALFEPYTDNPETRGFMRIDSDVLKSALTRFMRDGWQTNVHAIGDRANSIVLDVFESALDGINVTALRPRLEHAQIIRHADMTRLAEMGVIASVQPTHATDDMHFAEQRLGPERVKLLYAFRDIIGHGARITLGSDAPVETLDPLHTFFAAVSRVAPDGTSPHGPEGWFPEQRLSREEALKGITLDPAYASFTDDDLGSIDIGKRADYVILSQDIMTVPKLDILKTRVLATAMDGRIVYGGI